MELSSNVGCNLISVFSMIFLVAFEVSVDASTNTVIVESHFGKIRGLKNTDETTGQVYYSFKGIPYAKPPLGELRFTRSQPHPTIEGVFDATRDDKIVCPHPDLMTIGETEFTEDCLILNIQTKEIHSSNHLKKVLIFIHGGGFITGTSSFYDAKSFVISQDVIVAIINYRLGVLGFLSTENDASPGNYGLWDQTLAIKWVKDNIRAFGGDPDDITIAGESAGGAAVAYQMISPHTKGLFSKAYPQSGTATSVFSRSINPQSDALTVAKLAGCWDKSVTDQMDLEESYEVVQCLRKVPVSTLTTFNAFQIGKTHFVPMVDGDFIPDLPSKLLQDDDYLDSIGFFDRNYLIGVDNNERTIVDLIMEGRKSVIMTNNQTSMEEKEAASNDLYLMSWDLYMLSKVNNDKNAMAEIDDFYNRRYIGNNVLVEMVVDLNFLIPSLDYLKAASRRKSCSSYFVHFNHFPNFMKGTWRGTPHALDLVYWLDIDLAAMDNWLHLGINGEMGKDDLELKRMFSSIIGEFVRSGNPGQALKDALPYGWPKYDVINSYYLDFGPKPWIYSFLGKDKQDFWFKTVPSVISKPHLHTEL